MAGDRDDIHGVQALLEETAGALVPEDVDGFKLTEGRLRSPFFIQIFQPRPKILLGNFHFHLGRIIHGKKFF